MNDQHWREDPRTFYRATLSQMRTGSAGDPDHWARAAAAMWALRMTERDEPDSSADALDHLATFDAWYQTLANGLNHPSMLTHPKREAWIRIRMAAIDWVYDEHRRRLLAAVES